MPKTKIKPNKNAIQERAKMTVDAILQATTYILKRQGHEGLTTNKIAEKAGVNIASLYQYFPNKESILFYLHKAEWESTWDKLKNLIANEDIDPKLKLQLLITSFLWSEHEEVELRLALRQSAIAFQSTKEYKRHRELVFKTLLEFFRQFARRRSEREIVFLTQFVINLITGFCEKDSEEALEPTEIDEKARLISLIVEHLFANEAYKMNSQ
jgi:AcrR family transcriptional regulator